MVEAGGGIVQRGSVIGPRDIVPILILFVLVHWLKSSANYFGAFSACSSVIALIERVPGKLRVPHLVDSSAQSFSVCKLPSVHHMS